MGARETYNSSVGTAHGSAEMGGITFNTSGTVTPPGNATTWSRQSARVALAGGSITQAQFVKVMSDISTWEQTQINNARSVLQATDTAPA